MSPERCYICSQGPYVPHSPLNETKRLLVYGEAGGSEEARVGRGFWGASGRLLRQALRQGGLFCDSTWPNDRRIKPEDETVAFANCVPFTPNKNIFPGADAARSCLASCQPELLSNSLPWMACGANAVESLTGYRFGKFTDVRGTFLPVLNRPEKWVVSAIHPAFIVRGGKDSNPDQEDGKAQMALYPFLALDAKRAMERTTAWVPTVHFVGASETLAAFKRWVGEPIIAIDVEGGYNAPLSLIGLSWEPSVSYVLAWGPDTVNALREILSAGTVVFHNAAYDVPALEAEGVRLRGDWIDTINLAALLNPSVKVGLEAQVLTYVPGSVTWKGLINHNLGYQGEDKNTRLYERLHSEVLTRLGKPVPRTRWEWYVYYNGLDTAGTRLLVPAYKRELEAQGRANYYREIMQPLQEPLLRMGLRGMPVDLDRMSYHRRACERLERMAQRQLDRYTEEFRAESIGTLRRSVETLEDERRAEREGGSRKYSRAEELSKLRTKLRTLESATGFKGSSTPQRIRLLYGYLGLPEMRHRKTKALTTDEGSITELYNRLKKGTIKPKNATREEALTVCQALRAINKWSDWRGVFLTDSESEEGQRTDSFDIAESPAKTVM